jgi:fructosamine-3-kinase
MTEMNIQEIIKDLTEKSMLTDPIQYEQLSGGTTSKLYLCKDEKESLVIKLNEPHVLEEESSFLSFYKEIELLPKLLYADPEFHYIVYSYIPGSVHYNRSKKSEMLKDLVKGFINEYKQIPNPAGWGWADELSESWQVFLKTRFKDASERLVDHLPKEDIEFVEKLIESPNRKNKSEVPFMLHGDCGVHNFIFEDRKLCGVIDPTPIYGEPVYDLIYAFCSSPDDLTKETILTAVSHMKNNEGEEASFLYEEVLSGLFFRTATCVLHHPDDLEDYLKAWNYWMQIVKSS